MFCCLKVELCKLFLFQLERKQVVLGCLETQTTQDGAMKQNPSYLHNYITLLFIRTFISLF